LDDVLNEAGLDLKQFGEFAGNVEGLIRSARSPLARAQTIASHLPHHGGTSSYRAVGLACREFVAQDSAEFNARYFAAFVERAEKTLERNGGRRALKQEARHIDREVVDRERADREAAETMRLLATFQREQPERYRELQQQAAIGMQGSGTFRDVAVQARLAQLIGQEPRAKASA
jgi:hypothetical protein